jgi:outer membrane protein OmpU
MRNVLMFLSVTLGAAGAFGAEPLKLTVGGYVDTTAGYTSEKKAFHTVTPGDSTSPKRSNSGIVNETRVTFTLENTSPLGFKYGGLIKINADTSRDPNDKDDNVGNRTMLFVESAKYGRLEGGAYDAVSRKMLVSANSVGVANGGINGYMNHWINSKNIDGTKYSEKFVKWPELLTNCDCIPFPNKVSYYTPKVGGFQVGASYTPDSGVHGTVTELKSTVKQEDQNFKNIVDYGVTYENKYQGADFKVGLVGQVGKSKTLSIARKGLNAWEIGASIGYNGFKVVGSYSDWRNSATPSVKDANKKYGAKYWTAGAEYKIDKLTTSVSYFNGKRANVFATGIPATTASHDKGFNRNQYVVVGTSYKLAEGFLPYAEVSRFKTKLHSANANNSGYVILGGTELAF